MIKIVIFIVILTIITIITMITTGKTDITQITYSDFKKGFSLGFDSLAEGKSICPEGTIEFNNECKVQMRQSDCPNFEIPDPSTKNTTCKKLDENGKKEECRLQGNVFFENKCYPKLTNEYCKEQNGSYFKADPATNNTTCTIMNSDEMGDICSRTQTLFDGSCKEILTEKNCSKEQYVKPNEEKKNTECRDMKPSEIKEYCESIEKTYFNKKCYVPLTDALCKSSGWNHPNERKFFQFANSETNFTSCRNPTETEKTNICTKYGFQYNKDKDKCACPNGAEIRDGICISVKTPELCFPKSTATTKFASFLYPDPNNKTQCIDMNEDQKKDYCNLYKLESTDSDSTVSDSDSETKFIYRNSKCMKVFTEIDCKKDKSPPNYDNNKFYKTIFYKKPDETKDNTSCRKLKKDEEREICEKPENKSEWIANKCIKKLGKPTIEVKESGVNECRFIIKLEEEIKFIDYQIYFKIITKDTIYPDDWTKRMIGLSDIDGQNNLHLFINELIHNSEYKIKIKLVNNTYVNFMSQESDELEFKTVCDSSLYTDLSCRKNLIASLTSGKDSIYGPIKGDKFGKIINERKDPDVSTWPYIKIPNEIEEGKFCGCKEIDTLEQKKEWCKKNLYSDFPDREVVVHNDSCKLALLPVGPVENLSASGLNVNQTIKNDVYLEPDNFRLDFPNRVKIYWTYPEESINKSFNFNEAIPYTYKIERREKWSTTNEWTHIHDYVVQNEVDYENIKLVKDEESGIEAYNIFLDSNYKICPSECKKEEGGNYLVCGPNQCIGKNDFDKFYKKQKQINIPDTTVASDVYEGFSQPQVSSEKLAKQHKTFIWIDGDYGINSLFKPNKLGNLTNADWHKNIESLKSNTSYEYKITPINNSGLGKEELVEAKTIIQRISMDQCKKFEDKHDLDGVTGFKGFSQVPNEDQTSCITMPPRKRGNVCKNIKIKVGDKLVAGMYDPINKKCVPSGEYKLPGKPTVKILDSNKNSIVFEIIPPSKIGAPAFTGYWIEFNKKGSTKRNRLTYSGNFSRVNTILNESQDREGYYVNFPSESWLEDFEADKGMDLKIGHDDSIIVTHGYDLKPATEYEYLIRTVSNDALWENAPGSVNTTSDSGIILGASDLFSFSAKTDYSSPISNPEILSNIAPLFNKISLNISKFPFGFEGGEDARIIKYKITRVKYDSTKGTSIPESKIDFVIDFSKTEVKLTKSINGGKSTIIPNDNVDSKGIFLKNANNKGVLSTQQELIFIDKSVFPSTKYEYTIKSMNDKLLDKAGSNVKVLLWSDFFKTVSVKTPMKNYITQLDLNSKALTISNKQRSQSKYSADFATFKASIAKIEDPNINHYSDFPGVYDPTNTSVTFTCTYIHEGTQSNIDISAEISADKTKYEAIMKVPIKKTFKLRCNFEFIGSLNIPGQSSVPIICNGEKLITGLEITAEDIGLNEQVCKEYKDTILDMYTVPLYFNNDEKKCKSRKVSSNEGDKKYLDDYCKVRFDNTKFKWYGRFEEEPCKLPIDGFWKEIRMNDYYKNRCYERVDASTNILGTGRVCVNPGGKAYKPLRKWKYVNPRFGGANNKNKYCDVNGVCQTGNGKTSGQEYIEKDSDFGVKYAYLIRECNEATDQVGDCAEECKADENGILTEAGKGNTGLSFMQFNSNGFCKRPSFIPPQMDEFSNCETCGNPAGKNKNEEWLKTELCIDGANGSNNSEKCSHRVSGKKDSSGKFIVTPIVNKSANGTITTPSSIVKGKWYACTNDSIFNGIKDINGRNFCAQPTKQIQTETDKITVQKYFKIEDANCADENSGGFDLCKLEETKPDASELNHVCGTKIFDKMPKCTADYQNNPILWACTNTTIKNRSGPNNGKLMTPIEYYNTYLNTGNFKSKYVYKKEKCKDKCQGSNSGLSSDGYDKWLGSNDKTPNDSTEFRNTESGCVKADIIRPLYEEGIAAPGSSCSSCNGNPVKLFDRCIDGAFGPDSKTKCKKASSVDLGYTLTNKVTHRNRRKPNRSFGTTANVMTRTVGGVEFFANSFVTSNYNKNCPSKNCSWDYKTVTIDSDNLSRCRGDKKIINAQCKSKIHGRDQGVVDGKNCGPNPSGRIEEGTDTCRVMAGPKYDLNTLSKVNRINTTTKCNHPPPQFEETKVCKFPDGSKATTFGFSPINCYEKKNGYKLQRVESKSKLLTTGKQNMCNCKCTYAYYDRGYKYLPLGVPATGIACTQNNGNICQSCPPNMHVNSSKTCSCNSGYYWDKSTKKCVRDCKVGSWSNSGSCSRSTCQQKQVRSIVTHPDGGKSCEALTRHVGCNLSANCKWHGWQTEKKHNGSKVTGSWCHDTRQLKTNNNGCKNGAKQNCNSWQNAYKKRNQTCSWSGWSRCWSSCSASRWRSAWSWSHFSTHWWKQYDGNWSWYDQSKPRCWGGGWCSPGKGTRRHWRGGWYR